MKAAVFTSLPESGRRRLEGALEVSYGGWAITEPVLTPLPDDQAILALAGDAHAILVPGELSAEVIGSCQNLRVIGVARGDPRGVALETATRRGIAVVYAAGRNAPAVAELTLGFLIMLFRQLSRAHNFVAEGHWRTWDDLFATSLIHGHELGRRVLGLVGLGYVGREVARRARAFDMRVLGYDPYVPAEQMDGLGVEKTTLPDLLAHSDAVSLHCKVTPETRGLIGARQFNLMKPGAFFINTARAAVVDEEALLAALRTGRLAGAALDVYREEPLPPDSPLLGLSNVLHTPHIGGATMEVETRTAELVVEDVLAVLQGERPRHLANPEIYR